MTVRKAIALRSRLLIVCPSGLNPGFNNHTWSRLVNVGKELTSCLNPVQGGVAVGMLDPYDWIALWQLNLSRNPSLIFSIITTNVRHIMWVNVIFWDQRFATQDGPVCATHSAWWKRKFVSDHSCCQSEPTALVILPIQCAQNHLMIAALHISGIS